MVKTQSTADADIPMALFDIDEIVLGKCLGKGGFSDVYEIKAFKQNNKTNTKRKLQNKAARDFMTNHAKRENSGEARYAIKFLQEKWVEDRKGFQIAATDLATEADILTSIHHPNILKIRGWATDSTDAYYSTGRHDGYFLILDRLNETLEERIHRWKKQNKRLNHPFLRELIDKKGNKKRQLLAEKLNVAFDLAGALEHLHANNLIYRDLKPANVGFDVRNDVKLFDFGLCRDLPTEDGSMDDVFEMSGKVGTLRYMANEVARRQPYNQKADAYSFAHLLWEILTEAKPYEKHNRSQHKESVVKGGQRPTIDSSWPEGIQKLLSRAWDPDMLKRPSMKEIRMLLRREIAILRDGDTSGLEHKRRRSTFVLELPQCVKSKEMGLDESINRKSSRRSSIPHSKRNSIISRAA